jgi:pyruvate,orthophosphate dikinase
MKRAQHLVLHGLAIKKYANAAVIADIIDVPERDVSSFLESAVKDNIVAMVQDKYAISAVGKLLLLNEYSRFYSDLRSNDQFVSAYEKFETINVELKALITAWQVRDVGGKTITNDHADRDYDDKIIDRLGNLHERADRILAALAGPLPRMRVYREKLQIALERAEDGAIEWVSDAKIESYHTLWFELHEDLLCMLGHARQE